MPGLLITCEGIDGSGKTSFIPSIQNHFEKKGYTVVITREPGGTELAEKLRAMLLHQEMSPITEAMLMFAARRDHVEKVIAPALAEGKAVISDRFVDSSYAYQHGGKDVSLHTMSLLEEISLTMPSGRIVPDLTLWFDLEPEVARERRRVVREPDRFESKETDFFERVQATYANRFWESPDRIQRIDASLDREHVAHQVDEKLLTFLAKWP